MSSNGNILLSTKQQQFFRERRQALQQLDMQMQGAMQMIVAEKEIPPNKRVKLSDDCSELVIEDQAE